MPPELDQPAIEVTKDAAISVLICLFHYYAIERHQGFPYPRLSQCIYYHLEGLSQRDDLPELLRGTCDGRLRRMAAGAGSTTVSCMRPS